jgi:pectin methylesterase-like acyl-CoA thioesterase
MPFQGDGSNPFPALGDYRMQKLAGWTHNANAVVSYDKNGDAFSLFTAAVWGLSAVTNGKVYQTVSLQPGQYLLKIQVGGADGPVDIYGVVAKNGLPDYTEVASSTGTMKYLDLLSNQNKTVEIVFAVTDATPVDIGVVYNIRDQYGATGTPWSSFNLKGFELFKVE